MNERIGQLAEQAGLLGPSSRIGETHDATERFAELIVEECAEVILKWKVEPFSFDEDLAVRLIKEHFGVEK
jgi:L-2-hydroxyglutarate oxidase LhgO